MTTKELKADNLLLQAKLDDALAEIQELTNLVEHMEKAAFRPGLTFITTPEDDTICLKQINISRIHQEAISRLSLPSPADWIDFMNNTKIEEDEEFKELGRQWADHIDTADPETIGMTCYIDQLADIYKKRLGIE